MSRWRWSAVALTLGALLAGCSGDPEAITKTDTNPPLLVHDHEGERDAFFIGYLTYLEEANCIVFESEPSGPSVRRTPVWRKGTTPFRRDGKVAGLKVSGWGEIRLGALVRGGGGQPPKGTKIPAMPAECYPGEDTLFIIDRVERVD